MRKHLLPAALSLLLLITAAFAALQTDRLNRAHRTLEETYLSALNASAEGLQQLTLTLEKLLMSQDAAQQAALIHAVSQTSGEVRHCLASLPLSHRAMAPTLAFLTALTSSADQLLPSLMEQPPQEEARQELSTRLAACTRLSGQWALARRAMAENGATLLSNTSVFIEEPSTQRNPLESIGALDDLTDAGEAAAPMARGLPSNQVTREEARALARTLADDQQIISVSDAPDTTGAMPAYGFALQTEDVQLNVEMTVSGGRPLWMMPETAAFAVTRAPEECEAAALRYLERHGFGPAEAVHRQSYDGLYVVTLAPLLDGVLLYPDLITLQVRMDTLAVVGLEARSYWQNHGSRTLPQPSVTADQARAWAGEDILTGEPRLCLIPWQGEERLCWQLTAASGGDTYLIYLDSHTGREVTIRKLIPLENGDTAA